MGRSRYSFGEPNSPHFLTCTVVGWLPVFTRRETVSILLDSLQFLQAQGRIAVLGYVVLENHLHLVAASENLSVQIQNFKSYTARKIIDLLKEQNVHMLLSQLQFHRVPHKTDQSYQFWQEGSHPQMIEHEEVLRQKRDYIHMNPVKRGYVDEAVDWRYSSARNYARMQGLIPVHTDW